MSNYYKYFKWENRKHKGIFLPVSNTGTVITIGINDEGLYNEECLETFQVDSHIKHGDLVELDGIPPRRIVIGCIEMIFSHDWKRIQDD